MKLYSTNDKKITSNLKEAVFDATAKDNGLFMPTKIPKLNKKFFEKIDQLDFKKIALEVAKTLFGKSISTKNFEMIIKKTLSFPCPIKKIHPINNSEVYTLELFHGPTLAFKDFGARFMANLISHLLKGSKTKLHILAATSGDTGSAVGQAFFNLPNIRVSLLYPSKKISLIQEKQITTIGENVQALEINGTFDDCQKLVKTAFADNELRKQLQENCLKLSSANSINIARLIPQTFYYFYAYSQLKKLDKNIARKKIVISVPSGNLGNLTAGLIAKKMGLPIHKFIAATNKNDAFTRFLKTGKFKAKKTTLTISNAMDVGAPNNLVRIQELYDHDIKKMRHNIESKSFTDKQTAAAIKEVFSKYNYTMDPHGAVGYLGLIDNLKNTQEKTVGIFFETAHPAKFADIVEPIIKQKIPTPKHLQDCIKKTKKSIKLDNDYKDFLKKISP